MNDNDIDACNDAVSQQQNDATPQCANRQPTGYEQAIADTGYSSHCKIDNRELADCGAHLVAFDSLKHVTKEHDVGAGALLIEVLDKEVWLPKKLCSNLDLDNMTVRVWSVFLEDKLPELADMCSDNDEEEE